MKKAICIQVEKRLNLHIEKVWEAVAEKFGEVAVYNPAIKKSKLDSDITKGIGCQRHCDFNPKGYIKEQIIEWDEKRMFRLQLIESSVPLAFLESKFIFQEIEDGKATLITQTFWYRFKFPMKWMGVLMKGKMKKTLIDGLNGLEEYLNKK